MFTKEFNVKGKFVEGKIMSNWSNHSEHAVHISALKQNNYDDRELDKLIEELQEISKKIKQSNADHQLKTEMEKWGVKK